MSDQDPGAKVFVFNTTLTGDEARNWVATMAQLDAVLVASAELVSSLLGAPVPGSPMRAAYDKMLRDAYEQVGLLWMASEDHYRTVLAILQSNLLPMFSVYSLLRPAAEADVRMACLLDAAIDERQRLGRGLFARVESLREQSKVTSGEAKTPVKQALSRLLSSTAMGGFWQPQVSEGGALMLVTAAIIWLVFFFIVMARSGSAGRVTFLIASGSFALVVLNHLNVQAYKDAVSANEYVAFGNSLGNYRSYVSVPPTPSDFQNSVENVAIFFTGAFAILLLALIFLGPSTAKGAMHVMAFNTMRAQQKQANALTEFAQKQLPPAVVDRMKQLDTLKNEGLISSSEYDDKRKHILDEL